MDPVRRACEARMQSIDDEMNFLLVENVPLMFLNKRCIEQSSCENIIIKVYKIGRSEQPAKRKGDYRAWTYRSIHPTASSPVCFWWFLIWQDTPRTVRPNKHPSLRRKWNVFSSSLNAFRAIVIWITKTRHDNEMAAKWTRDDAKNKEKKIQLN